jgi:acetylornithine deacetylase/succinyl-diaminopimelate desuccinylase-like protein
MKKDDHSNRIDEFLKENLEVFIHETSVLCAQPSVSASGEGVQECATLVAQTLQNHGLQVQTFPTTGNPIILGRADGLSKRRLLFYNHYDVQPPEPLDLWTTPPFEPHLREGALYARGSKDDKGELMARIAAVDAVRSINQGTLPCGVIFVVEGEEEIGSPHIAQFVREHLDYLQCQGAIWEEGSTDAFGHPDIIVGKRGILTVELIAETMKTDAHSGAAHYLPNAAWRLHQALSILKGPDGRILIPGFYDHALPPSPSDQELLMALPDYENWARQTYGVKEFVGGLSGKEINLAVFEPTCNIQGLTAGYQGPGTKTVIPAQAIAKIDFRLVPDQDPDDIFSKLRSYLDAEGFADIQLIRLGAMWPAKISTDNPLVELTSRTGSEVYQKTALVEPLSGGSSPVYAFSKPLGDIPVVTAGVGYGGNKTHAPDEHLRLVDFLNASRHIARILDGFADLPD